MLPLRDDPNIAPQLVTASSTHICNFLWWFHFFVIIALFLIHFLVTASTTHIWSHKLFAMVALSHQCLTSLFILSTEIIFMRAFITPLQAHMRLATNSGTLFHWGIKTMVKYLLEFSKTISYFQWRVILVITEVVRTSILLAIGRTNDWWPSTTAGATSLYIDCAAELSNSTELKRQLS